MHDFIYHLDNKQTAQLQWAGSLLSEGEKIDPRVQESLNWKC